MTHPPQYEFKPLFSSSIKKLSSKVSLGVPRSIVSIFLGFMMAILLLPVFGALFSVGLAQSQTQSVNTLAKPGVISDKGFYSG
ncbi:MAG: hypothetical protein K2X66_02250, partial [Cyanobacteria bacterium]|nr:hypothetical protein [Cyanobacteriota bacterium]